MLRTHSFGRSYIVTLTTATASWRVCQTIRSADYRQFLTCLLDFYSSCLVVKVYQSIQMRNELHWLRLPQRITYKLCLLLTFKSLRDQAPVYLARRCVRVSSKVGRARLRSASSGQLIVPRTSKKTFSDRAFACSGPISWNSLSTLVRDDSLSLHSFKKLLKYCPILMCCFLRHV